MLEIVNSPSPVLSKKAKPILKIDKAIVNLIKQMKIALAKANDPIGVGLAGPQVGKNLQIFIAKPTLKSKFLVFINPEIVRVSHPQKKLKVEKTRKLEGCLSLPHIWGEVLRYNSIFIKYQDEKGIIHNRKFTGFLATIIQHEIDHLDGILFPKKVLEQKGTLYQSEKNDKGEDIFQELKV